MPAIRIFTSGLCPFCYRAKALLDAKGLEYEEIDVTFSPGKRREMAEESGRTSVPQIWIGETHVGGSDELHALEAEGKLDDIIAAAA